MAIINTENNSLKMVEQEKEFQLNQLQLKPLCSTCFGGKSPKIEEGCKG